VSRGASSKLIGVRTDRSACRVGLTLSLPPIALWSHALLHKVGRPEVCRRAYRFRHTRPVVRPSRPLKRIGVCASPSLPVPCSFPYFAFLPHGAESSLFFGRPVALEPPRSSNPQAFGRQSYVSCITHASQTGNRPPR